MTLKCLALATSPRQQGNTAILAGKALEGCSAAGCATELLRLSDYRFEPCRACGGCNKTGRCVVRDDAAILYTKVLEADRLILAGPIFSMGLLAQAKAFIDRSQQFWATKYLLQRPVIESGRPPRLGIFISCGGTSYAHLFQGAMQVVRYFFHIMEIDLDDVLCYSGVDRLGEIRDHPSALEEAYQAGMKLGNP